MTGHSMNLMEVAEKFGGWAFAFALLVERFVPVLPAIVNRLVPQLQQKQRAEEERLSRELEARIDREREEQNHRHQVDNRTVSALEALTGVVQDIRVFMATIDDRLGGMEFALKSQDPKKKTVHKKRRT